MLCTTEINKLAQAEARATTLSISSMLYHIFYGVLSLFIGGIAQAYGIPFLYITLGIGIFILGCFMMVVKERL